MLKYIFIVTIVAYLPSCKSNAYKRPHVLVDTKLGEIEIELFADNAPKTVGAFLANVDAGNYENTSFYRVLNDDNQPSNAPKANLVQGGLWKTNYKLASTLPEVAHETTKQTGLLHKDGTVSLARREPGTGSTEFFICIGDQPGFDFGGVDNADRQGYAAFGKVVKGMEIVRKIYNRPEYEQYFDPPIMVYGIKRM